LGYAFSRRCHYFLIRLILNKAKIWVVPLDSNHLFQIKNSLEYQKVKKKKRLKNKKKANEQPVSNQHQSDQKEESNGGESDFGGMNMGNFNKNLGCGS
jgi:hypothetical protein